MIIFRKNALNKISSAEELDKSIFIVSSISWLILLTIIVIAIIFVIWSIFAHIKTEVKSQGIFLPKNSIIADITTNRRGLLKEFKATVGDYVKVGDTVAILSSDKLEEEFAISKRQLDTEKIYYEKVRDQIANEKKLRDKENKLHLSYIDSNIASLQKEITLSKTSYEENEKLYKDHLITEQKLNNLFITLNQNKIRLNDLILNKTNVLNQSNKLSHQENLKLAGILKNVNSRKDKVELLDIDIKNLYIKVQISGLITEIKAIKNSQINSNEAIMSVVTHTDKNSQNTDNMKSGNKSLEYLAYVDVFNGKKITPGTDVNIEVSYLSRNTYGMVKGKVKSVSSFPLSSTAIKAKLSNVSLVNLFTKKGPVYEITVDLLKDENQHLRWTSAKGSKVSAIEIGSLGFASFITERRRPISFAIPWLKSILD